MSDKAGKAVEMKVGKGYAGAPEVKKFSFYDIFGMRKVFYAIEISNAKRTAKVDYWLNKNQKALHNVWKLYEAQEIALIKKFAETKEVDGKVYDVWVGKDDTDLLLNKDGIFYKEEEGKLTEVANPYWEHELPAKEEGGEWTVQKMRYVIKFTDKPAFDTELGVLQDTFAEPVELYGMKADNLEGVNVMWQGKEEDLTQFRSLIYDNAIFE